MKSQLTGILAANFGGVNTGGLLLANICNSQVGIDSKSPPSGAFARGHEIMGILEIAAIPQIGTFDSGLLEWLVGLQLPACHVGKASQCNDA